MDNVHACSYIIVSRRFMEDKRVPSHPIACVCLCGMSGHNLPDKSCVADSAMQIELA